VPVTSAPRPGWHGIAPSADRYVPPLQLDAPDETATEPEKAPALWVELEYPGGRKQTVKGFAMAWTKDAVYAQWIEFSRAREAWVLPKQCTRRQLAASRDTRTR
jgi:hypothetical protein